MKMTEKNFNYLLEQFERWVEHEQREGFIEGWVHVSEFVNDANTPLIVFSDEPTELYCYQEFWKKQPYHLYNWETFNYCHVKFADEVVKCDTCNRYVYPDQAQEVVVDGEVHPFICTDCLETDDFLREKYLHPFINNPKQFSQRITATLIRQSDFRCYRTVTCSWEELNERAHHLLEICQDEGYPEVLFILKEGTDGSLSLGVYAR